MLSNSFFVNNAQEMIGFTNNYSNRKAFRAEQLVCVDCRTNEEQKLLPDRQFSDRRRNRLRSSEFRRRSMRADERAPRPPTLALAPYLLQ
jgi:hypothetical protein